MTEQPTYGFAIGGMVFYLTPVCPEEFDRYMAAMSDEQRAVRGYPVISDGERIWPEPSEGIVVRRIEE